MRGFVGRRWSSGTRVASAAATDGGSAIAVEFADGTRTRFHGVFLRDCCPCAACTSASGQKTYFAALGGAGAAAASAAGAGHGGARVDVRWADGHASSFEGAWLRQYRYDDHARAAREQARAPRLWRGDELRARGGPRRLAYAAVVDSDAGQHALVRAVVEDGLALVTGAPLATRTVATVAERLGPVRSTMYGDVWDVVSVDRPVNIAYTDAELMLHQDILYYELTPGVQLLHCLQNDATGGESRFADGLRAAEDFRAAAPAHFDLLARVRVGYHKVDAQYHLRNRRPLFAVDPESGRVAELHFSAPFQAPLDAAYDDVPRWYDAYGAWLRHVARPEYSFERLYRPGDVVVFNNRRVLHARAAYQGPRHLQGTYVDLDDLYSRYRQLHHAHVSDSDLALTVPDGGGRGAY
jgi:gamma-butyrobetaine dioxygenase